MRPIALFIALATTAKLWPLPQGFHPVTGDIAAENSGDQCIVSSSGNSIVNWDSFSVLANEQVQFIQDASSSAVLNRVIGGEKSELWGSLVSNGRVYFVNPAGIFIGPDATIDTSAFLASTLDVLDGDFLGGAELLFSGISSGSIVNLGTIRTSAGDVVLCARNIDSGGIIEAQSGDVYCASGAEILYKPNDLERVYIRIGSGGDPVGSIAVSGIIESAQVELGESNPYGKAIQIDESTEALSLVRANGKVWLASDGRTQLSGKIASSGGEVSVYGKQVILSKDSKIDVSSDAGGGSIHVGGTQEGGAPIAALETIVFPGSELHADSNVNGNGGSVTLLSDDITAFGGSLSAKGGSLSGNGGFIEVSGPRLDARGATDLSAPNGKAGSLLFDPYDVTISSSMEANESFDGTTYTPMNTGANIDVATLNSNLMSGNIIVVTSGAGAEQGNITISDPISSPSAFSLTLTADGVIFMNADVTNGGEITFTANAAGGGNDNGITIANGFTLTSTASNITLTGTAGDNNGLVGIELDGTITVADGMTLTMTGSGGGFTTGASNHGVVLSSSSTLNLGVGSTAVLTGTGGVGSSGLNNGVYVQASTTISMDDSSVLRFKDCTGGGGDTSSGVEIGADIHSSNSGATIEFANLTGGNNSGINNNGFTLDDMGVLNVPIIRMADDNVTDIRGGPGSGMSNCGVAINGTLGGSNTSEITLVGIGGGGISASGFQQGSMTSLIDIPDGATLTLTGTGGGGGSSMFNTGILFIGQTTLGSTTGATAVLTGVGGEGTGGQNIGVVFNNFGFGPGTLTLNGASTLTFADCQGGSASTADTSMCFGIFLKYPITSTDPGSVIEFSNISAGGFGAGTQNYGLYIDGVAISAGEIRMASSDTTHIQGGAGTGTDNHGIFITDSGAILGSSTDANNISLIGVAQATGADNYGIAVTSGGVVQTAGAGTITLNGTGSAGSGTDYGILVNGTGSTIQIADGSMDLTGAVDNTNTAEGILVNSGGALVSDTGSISLTTVAPAIIGQIDTITSTSGDITFHNAVVFAANSAISTLGAIAFDGTVDGPYDLNFSAGTSLSLTNPVGSSAPPASLTGAGATVLQTSTVVATGAVQYTGAISLGDGIATSGGNITLDGSVSLNQSLILDTGTGASITCSGTVDGIGDGAQSLTIRAGTGASSFVVLGDAVGATHYLDTISIDSATNLANAITLGGSIHANGISIPTDSPILLTGNCELDTHTTNSSFDLPNSFDGGFDLTFNPGTGSVSLSNQIGATTAVGNVIVSSGAASFSMSGSTINASSLIVPFGAPTQLGGDLAITTTGDVDFFDYLDGAYALSINAGGDVRMGGPVGSVSPLGSLAINATNIVQSSNANISGAVSYTGAIQFNGVLNTNNGTIAFTGPTVVVGIASLLTTNFNTSSGNDITIIGTIDGFTSGLDLLTIGSGSAGITSLSGDIGGTNPLRSLSIDSSNTTPGAVKLGGDIKVYQFTVPDTAGIVLTGNTTIDTSGGPGFEMNIQGAINGTTAGSETLSLIVPGFAGITLGSNLGGTVGLGTISLSSTGSGQLYFGPSVTSIVSNGLNTNSNLVANIQATTPLTIDTHSFSPGDISFGGLVTATTRGVQSLILNAGTGDVTFAAEVGVNPLGSLTVSSSGTCTVQANVLVTGLISISAERLVANGQLISLEM